MHPEKYCRLNRHFWISGLFAAGQFVQQSHHKEVNDAGLYYEGIGRYADQNRTLGAHKKNVYMTPV